MKLPQILKHQYKMFFVKKTFEVGRIIYVVSLLQTAQTNSLAIQRTRTDS